MVSANVTSQSVQNVTTIATTTGPVGYMLFNDHLGARRSGAAPCRSRTLQSAGVQDLVLDIRYNGGGYLDIASEVAYMIAGRGPTAGMTFELTQFNSKHPTVDPVTGATIQPEPFLSTQRRATPCLRARRLPALDLTRVFVLTGPDTCSASEAIINSLRGHRHRGDSDRLDHLRQALRVLSAGQLRHDLLLDRVPRRQRRELRRLHGRLLAE